MVQAKNSSSTRSVRTEALMIVQPLLSEGLAAELALNRLVLCMLLPLVVHRASLTHSYEPTLREVTVKSFLSTHFSLLPQPLPHILPLLLLLLCTLVQPLHTMLDDSPPQGPVLCNGTPVVCQSTLLQVFHHNIIPLALLPAICNYFPCANM